MNNNDQNPQNYYDQNYQTGYDWSNPQNNQGQQTTEGQLTQEEQIKQLQNQLLQKQQQNDQLQQQQQSNAEMVKINPDQAPYQNQQQSNGYDYPANSGSYQQQNPNDPNQQNMQQFGMQNPYQMDMQGYPNPQQVNMMQQQMAFNYPQYMKHAMDMMSNLNNSSRFNSSLQINPNHVLIDCHQIMTCQSQLTIQSDSSFPKQLQGKLTEQEWSQKIKDLKEIKNYGPQYGWLGMIVVILVIIVPIYTSSAIFSVFLLIMMPFLTIGLIFASLGFMAMVCNYFFEKALKEWLQSFNKILERNGCKIARDRYKWTTMGYSSKGRRTQTTVYQEKFIIATQPQDIQPLISAADNMNYNGGCMDWTQKDWYARY